MFMSEKALLKKEQFLFEMLVPLGFECQHSCRYKHVATGEVFDFSATNMDLKDIIHCIISKTAALNFKKGRVEVKTAIADLLDVREDKDAVYNAQIYG